VNGLSSEIESLETVLAATCFLEYDSPVPGAGSRACPDPDDGQHGNCVGGVFMAEIKYRSYVFIAPAVVLALLGAVAWTSYGQFERSKYTSPPANVTATIAGDPIRIEYYAPSMHGRKIMGGLVPFGVVWCTGANWATKITTEANLEMGSLTLPAGSYSIWTLPNQNEWVLILNKQTGQFHLNYDSSQDFGRAKMNLKTLAAPIETFKIELRSDGGNKGTLALLWEATEASIPFEVLR
jgi:hypothetical protein